eukprot:CAMPEP_0180680586 /NCGR_PEP_ID=MMETSP1037_2-20121125/69559_1 /TAXON_ID=632150 /ORGANISM="Azadinium spinosum, Strain 3D9" /LENGTH=147 /DNA_ID=CAMNT_0022710435 /DNA_START=248 /DNA_END=688 /DNA_ORIENTATION=+
MKDHAKNMMKTSHDQHASPGVARKPTAMTPTQQPSTHKEGSHDPSFKPYVARTRLPPPLPESLRLNATNATNATTIATTITTGTPESVSTAPELWGVGLIMLRLVVVPPPGTTTMLEVETKVTSTVYLTLLWIAVEKPLARVGEILP